MRIATIGMFDGVHRGHRYVIGQLCRCGAERGLRPTVFTFDRHPLQVIAPERAPRLLTTMSQRVDYMLGCGAPDVVFMHFDEVLRSLTDREFMRMLHDRYEVCALLLGFNHRFGYKSSSSFDDYCRLGTETGIEVIRAGELPDMPDVSSSAVRRLVLDGDIAGANDLLGHDFAVRGHVVHGRGLGHTIGFPTVNITPWMHEQVLPARGVYAAEAVLPGNERHPAMVNVGVNPTVNDSPLPEPRIEAHIIDYDGDLYDRPVTLCFTRWLRDEMRFPSIAALRHQLAVDRRAVIGI